MVTPQYQVRCTRNDVIARDIYETVFEKPAGFSFKAGQFILFDVPLPDNPADIQPRAYSIASAPGEKELLFVLKLIPNGRMSRYLVEALKPGMELTMKGPFGFFVIPEHATKDLFFICTSTGNAPFRSQIVDLLAKGYAGRIDLVYGVRSEEDLFWREEFEELAQRHPNFSLHLSLTKPSASWSGHVGRVQTVVPLVAPSLAGKHVYVCGSPDMTKEVKQLCLNEWGVDKADLHVEGYI